MFSSNFKFDGREFNSKSSLAFYLKKNFKKSLSIIDDGSLMSFLSEEKPDLSAKILELSKDFESKENILTLIIYMLDNTAGINTPNYQFKSNYEISDVMKKNYPNVDPDIKKLFSDKVLSHIFWNEFVKTNDLRYKRNYTFMLHIYENRMFEFTYFYYLYLHLDKNETIRFTLDGVKMKSLSEITNYLALNIDRSGLIIDEILRNPYILALMAINSGIDIIAGMLMGNKRLEILKCLQSYASVDLTPVIKRKMCYWLLINYQYYNFETEEAKALLVEYGKLSHRLTLSTIADYVEIYDVALKLYTKFLSLFNHNKIVAFKNGITATDDYYLNYRFNDEYVCKKFLEDNSLFDPVIHTSIHNDTVEREILVDRLEEEKKELVKFQSEVLELTNDLHFEEKKLTKNLLTSSTYLIMVLVSLFGGLLFGKQLYEDDLSKYVYYALLGMSIISILLGVFCIVKYSSKVKNAELVHDAIANCEVSLKSIEKEEELTLNPNSKTNHRTLRNLATFAKHRKNDLNKIRKISKKKTSLPNVFIIMYVLMATLPILEFGLTFALHLLDIEVFTVFVNNVRFNLISLGLLLLSVVLLTIFKNKRIVYRLIYLYIILLTVISIIL